MGDALAIFMGPDAYVSPSWYPSKRMHKVVPTWNYAVVHATGAARVIEAHEQLVLGPQFMVKPVPDFFAEAKMLLGEAAIL